MSKLTFVFTVLFASLAGCAGESANSSPPASPADNVDFKYNGPDDDEGAKSKDDDSKKTDDNKAESAKAETQSSKPNKSESDDSSAAPPHKACPGLTKAKCQISSGCAWHTDNKCVAQ
jgi:hypothetical protein